MAHLLPVVREYTQLVGVEATVTWAEAQRRDDGGQVRLGGQAAHCVHRTVRRVDTRLDRHQHACSRNAARVVRVEVHRDADLLLERLYQCDRRARLSSSLAARMTRMAISPRFATSSVLILRE